ncbi:MAG: PKD domain-containing protein [Bacteroidetes bacterium]|nr:PKD domain-containing protein [Bacteroidota bacterium]
MARKVRYSIIIQLVILFTLLSNNAFSQVVFGVEDSYCRNSPVDTIFGVFPTNGTFPVVDAGGLATGVTQISDDPDFGFSRAIFDPSKADIHIDHVHIVYDGKEFKPKIDDAPPAALLAALAPMCEYDAIHVLSEGSPGGGGSYYIVNGVKDITDFDPGVYGFGTHAVQYVTVEGFCEDTSVTQLLEVGPPPVTFTGLGNQYCDSDGDVNFVYSPAGGTFTVVQGLTDHGGGSATFSPAISGAATRDIEYIYTDGFGCDATLIESVQVDAPPVVSFTGLAAGYCINGAVVTLIGNQAPQGTFSGPGITDNGNGTGSFDPSGLTVGGSPYTVTYTYTDGATTCTNSISEQTNILALPTATISGTPTVCIGDPATLDVNFTGTGPFDFTYTDGTSSSTITNAGNPYSISVSPAVSSVYNITSVSHANGCSDVGSGIGTVNVIPLSVITAHPADIIACTGNNASFVVTATGADLAYQWQYNGVNILLANSSILNLNIVDALDAGNYQCIVSSSCGPDLTSNAASLQILPAVDITTQPTGVTDCEGNNISFTLQAVGSGLSYRWRRNGIDMSDLGNIMGSASNTLVISNISLADVAVYTCYVNGDCGDQISVPVTLTMDEEIDIITQPNDKSVCTGGNTSLSVAVTGTNPLYQWQHNNTDIIGATSPTLNLTAVDALDAGSYHCIVSGTCETEISDLVTLVVYENVSIDLQPTAVFTCEGSMADFNIAASGSITGYQWRQGGTDLVNGGDVSGANSPNLSIINLNPADAGGYSCVVSGECGTQTSITAGLVVDEAVVITSNPVDQEFCETDDVIFTTVVTGTNLLYQWYKDGGLLAGEIGSTLVITGTMAADVGSYHCEILNSCGSQTSGNANLSLNDPTLIVTEPSGDIVCEGDNANMTVDVTGSNISYAWIHNGIAINDVGGYSGTGTGSLFINNVDVTHGGVYICEVSGSCGDLNSAPAVLTVNENITVTSQPLSKSICPGNSTSFSIAVTGTNPVYQWQHNNTDIVGATSPTLNLLAVDALDAGIYHCIITGTCETEVSDQVTLEVYENVSINLQPTAVFTCEGSTADFNTAASGSITGYQWRLGGTDLVNGGDVSGANSPNLSIINLDPADAGGYTCVVSGECGSQISNTAGLVVDEAIVITSNPVDQDFCETDDVIFTTVVTGTNLLYQWYKDGGLMAGENGNSLVITGAMAADAGSYFCEVSNSCATQTSSITVLSLNDPTLIITDPLDDIVCEGDNANMTVDVTGSNITYAWTHNGIALNDVGVYSGTQTSSLLISNLDVSHGGVYVCEVSGSCGDLNSAPAVLTVNENIIVTSQPANQTVCPGTNVQLEVNATGTNLSYQWQLDGVDIPFAANNSAINNTLLIPGASGADEGIYRCRVSGDCGTTLSNAASLTLTEVASIVSHPSNQQICEGNNVSLSVAATGTLLSFQWKKNGVDLVNDGRITGVNSSTLNINNLTEGDQAAYSCQVSNSCGFENTIPASLVVDELVLITTQPVVFNAVETGNASFSVSATGDILSYQWYKVSDGLTVVDGGVYGGATSPILTLTNLDPSHADSYYCVITGICSTVTSEPGLLNVSLLTLISVHPADPGDKCVGESASFNVVAAGTNLAYTWRKNGVDLVDDLRITGSATASLNIDNLQVSDLGSFSCLVTGDEGPENSLPATLTVNELTDVILQPLDGTQCEGDDAVFVIEAAGNITAYQWQMDGVNLVDDGRITGALTASLSITNLSVTDEGIYTCIVTGLCANDISNPATLMVDENTAITSQPTSLSGCTGTAATFSITADGGGISYQWKKGGANLVNDGRISGVNTSDLTISNIMVSDGAAYSCEVSGPCGSDNSILATLSVSPETLISSQPSDKELCEGDDAIFMVEADGLALNYEWRLDGLALVDDGVHIVGSGTETLIVSDLVITDEGSYQCFVTGTCGDYLSNPANLIVNELVQILTHPIGDTRCFGQSISFSVLSGNLSNSFQWKKDGVKLTEGGKYSGVNTPNLSISDLSATEAGVFSCLVTGICDSLNSGLATLEVLPTTIVTMQPLHQNVDEGVPLTFTVEAVGDLLTYQWQKDGTIIPGATSDVYTIPAAATTDEGAYTCLVSGTCNATLSDPANLIVNELTLVITNPVSLTRCEGGVAVFEATASGENLSYEWRKDGVAIGDIGAKISGSGTPNLTISAVDLSDVASYTCVISGSGGVVSSGAANLIINPSTILVSQPPAIQTKCESENVFFAVDVSGDNLSYSWERDGGGLFDGGNIFGSGTGILTVSNVSTADAGVYRCVITGTCGDIITDPSTLTVNELPATPGAVTGDDIICQGVNLKAYEVPVIANAISYEWTLPFGATIENGAGTRFIVANYALDAVSGNITVRGRNSCGVGLESVPLAITVNPKPLADAGYDESVCSTGSTLNANNNPNGTWSLLSGFATFDDANLFNTGVTYLGKGDNVLMWTVTENNCTSTDTLTVTNNLVSLDAGPDQVLCGNSTTLNALVPEKGTGSWSVVSGAGGASIANPANPNSDVNYIQQGANYFVWTVNYNGCNSRDTLIITNDDPSNAYAGKDTILLTDTYTLEGNTPVIGTGTWSLVTGSGSITNPSSPTSIVTNLGIGENIFKWVITNNSCYFEDEVKVLNYSPSIIDAGPDQTLCSDYATLSGSQPNYGSGQWTIVQGSGSFVDASDYMTEVINMGQGDNVFKWTIYEYEVQSDEVTITNDSPIDANAGIDQRLCDEVTSLSGNEPLVGTGQWFIMGGSADIADVNSYNTSVSKLSLGTNTFRWIITNGICSSSDDLFIVNDMPTTADAGVDQLTCEDSITLFPNTPSIGTGEWSLLSGSATFSGNKANNLAKDDNYFKWTISNNGCFSTDTVMITSHKPTQAVAMSSKSLCVDDMFLPGNAPLYGTGEWSILSGSATLTDPTDANTLADNLQPGLNTLRWTITYEECTLSSEIDLSYDLIIADAGADQSICDDVALMLASNAGVGVGQWSIAGGTGSANFSDANNPNTEVNGLDRGDNLLRWTINNENCVSYDEVIISNNMPSIAHAGADRSVCGEDFYLNANNPTVGTGEWSVLSGAANIESPDQYNSDVTNLSLGHNTLRWTIRNGACTSLDEINIINDLPTNINAGPDQYLCSDSTELYSSDPVGGYGRWSISKGSASFENNTLFNTDVSNLEQGENNLVWTVTIAGCSNSDTILIVNNLPSIPSAGPDQDVCANETFMGANAPQLGAGHWSIVSGSATFEDPNDPYTQITDIGIGNNLISWTTTNGSCRISDEVTIINSLPTTAYAGEDRAICNTTANLLANPPVTGTGIWKVVSGFGIIDDAYDYNTQISVLGFGKNTLRWTTTNGRCTSTDDVVITNNLAEVYAGLDEVIYQSTVQLVGNKPMAGQGQWQLVAGTGNIQNPDNFETSVFDLGEGANTFHWTIDNDGCIATDDAIITYYVLPEVDFLPSPQQGCPPLLVDFINSSVGGFPYSWDFGDGIVSSESNPMHTYNTPGTYNVRLSGTGPDGIFIVKDTMVIVHEQPVSEFEVTPGIVYISDPPNKFDEPINCYNLTSEYDSLVWDFGDGQVSNEINPTHHYLETGVYDVTLHVYTGFQCYDSETILEAVTVKQKGSIQCPNVFSPNLGGETGGTVIDNDYSNDVFHCYAEGLLEYRLEVFNRHGVRMFESEDINVGWDGYFDGKLASEGVYAFRISGTYNNGEKFSQVGSVMIIFNE